MTYPPAPLQQQNYSQYPSPYSVSALSTGQTPGEHGLYVQADPAPASNPNLTAGFPYAEEHASGPTGQSDIKARLRKACDSCSTRKVK
ncbi:hypothetical protein MMC13_000357, partial [Lambiella insularis]|nr:hypothetical protein [Lambiella insularis]